MEGCPNGDGEGAVERVGPPALNDRLARRLLIALVAIATFEQARISWVIGRSITQEDQTLLWHAAREWGRLRVHQPNYYGQSYGSTIEAIPLELLRRAGLSLWTGYPIVMGVLALAGWLFLAAAAWQRGHRVLALAAAAAPTLLSAQHYFFATEVPDAPGPRLLAVAGAAVLITRPSRLATSALGWALLGLGGVMEPGTLLLSIPVAAWLLFSGDLSGIRCWAPVIGAVPALGFLAWWWTFYRRNPDFDLHGGLAIVPDGSLLGDNLDRLDAFFRLYAPELLRSWFVPVAAGALLVVALISTRRARYLVAALGATAVVLVGMSTPKSSETLGPLFPSGRILATLPYALWFLAVLAAESGVLRLTWVRRPVVVAGLSSLVLASLIVRTVDFESRVWSLRTYAVEASFYRFRPVEGLWGACDHAVDVAQQTGTSLTAFVGANYDLTYGCSAYRDVDTLGPEYERRTWRLYEEHQRTRTSVVMVGVGRGFCRFAAPRVETCTDHGRGVLALRFPRQSALLVLWDLGVTVRAFGPGCRLQTGVHRDCPQSLVTDLDDTVVGAAPSDPDGAHTMIGAVLDRAFSRRQKSNDMRGRVDAIEHELPGSVRVIRDAWEQHSAGLASVDLRSVRFRHARLAVVDVDVRTTNGRTLPLRGHVVHVGGEWRVASSLFHGVLSASELSGTTIDDG